MDTQNVPLLLSFLGNIILPIAGFIFGQWKEKKQTKRNSIDSLDKKLSEFLEKIDNKSNKAIIRYAFTSLQAEFIDFCKLYKINLDNVYPKLADLHIYATAHQANIDRVSETARELRKLLKKST